MIYTKKDHAIMMLIFNATMAAIQSNLIVNMQFDKLLRLQKLIQQWQICKAEYQLKNS